MNEIPVAAIKRLYNDYSELLDNPIDGVLAHPTDGNIYQWHFAIAGPPDCPFEGGLYHGELLFSPDYPMRPPSICFITPNGLFECNTDLCVSNSETRWRDWSPGNTVSSILSELWLSFCDFNDSRKAFTNKNILSNDTQRDLAQKSWTFNLKDKTFCKYFPQLMEVIKEDSNENVDENANVVPEQGQPIPVVISQGKRQKLSRSI